MNRRNDIKLSKHFKLSEFENSEGFCMVHPSVVKSLEGMRADLCRQAGIDVPIRITCALRTEAENRRLARRYGWTDQGGRVARNSKHLPRHCGIAVDIKAIGVPYRIAAEVARKHFDYVKTYRSRSHIHCDNRGELTS